MRVKVVVSSYGRTCACVREPFSWWCNITLILVDRKQKANWCCKVISISPPENKKHHHNCWLNCSAYLNSGLHFSNFFFFFKHFLFKCLLPKGYVWLYASTGDILEAWTAVSEPQIEDIWYCIHHTVQVCYVAQARYCTHPRPPSTLSGGMYEHVWLTNKLHEERTLDWNWKIKK